MRKHSVSRLQRTFPRAVTAVLAAVAVQSTVALCLNYLDVVSSEHDTSAKTLAYVEYLVVHVATQLCILWFYAGTCWYARRAFFVRVCVFKGSLSLCLSATTKTPPPPTTTTKCATPPPTQ